ncbi:11455_t:CDS:2 [Scutellospora calospora]|uniref:11455_t:CDS:1 n=1 Tax=Scutellospora calospora TaxID=85575 RepID=A0ACA9KYG3_9GLOM|nr:11455_t:CDS:2 [Scutellospora calospora]
MASPDDQKELKKKEELEFYTKFEQKIQPAIEEFRNSFPNGPHIQPRGPMPLGNCEIPFDEWCSFLVRAPPPTPKQRQYVPPLSAQQKNATQVAPNRQAPVGSDRPPNGTASSNSSKNKIGYLDFLEELSKQNPGYDSFGFNRPTEEAEHIGNTLKTMKFNTDNSNTYGTLNKMNRKDPLPNGRANVDAGKRDFTREDAKIVLEKFYETRKRKASFIIPTLDDLPNTKNPRGQKAPGHKRNPKDVIMTDREFTCDDERALGDPPALPVTNNPVSNDSQKPVKQLIVKLKIPQRKQDDATSSQNENSWLSQQRHSKGIKSQIVEVGSNAPDYGIKGVKPLENGSTKEMKMTKVREYQDVSRAPKRKLIKSASASDSRPADVVEFDETFRLQTIGQTAIEHQSPVITVQTVGNQTDSSFYTRSVQVCTRSVQVQTDPTDTDDDRSDMALFHHTLFERKSAIGREYKHRAEKDTEKRSPLERVSDYLESFLRYTEAVFHQHEADKNGYSYNCKYLNLEKLFDFIRVTIEKQGNETPLASLVKFVKAVILLNRYQLEINRCRQAESELLKAYINETSILDSKSTGAAFDAYMNSVETTKKSYKTSTEQFTKIHQTFEESKKQLNQLGKLDLNICTDLKKTLVFAQEMVDKWRDERGIKPEQITDITTELEETNYENPLNDMDNKLFEEYIDLELNTLNGILAESEIIY